MSTSTNEPLALIERIDACLPQTQCTQCGYPRCRAYAEALAAGSAGINQCPPGGDVTIRALSVLLHATPQPLDPRFGSHKPRARAVIDETLCIGCRKCIDACPVDAIVGARKLMHTVIARECTGCELCLPPCPVDCIAMVPSLTEHARSASGSPQNEPDRASARTARSSLPSGDGMGVRGDHPHPLPSPAGRGEAGERLHSDRSEGEGEHGGEPWPEYTRAETARWRLRTEKRVERLTRTKRVRRRKSTDNATNTAGTTPLLPNDREKIRAEIRAAVERVRIKKRNRQN
jgi:electron transport complex protein RnfB